MTNPRVEGVVAQSSSSQGEHGPEPVDLPEKRDDL
jgi:hypothetical protein